MNSWIKHNGGNECPLTNTEVMVEVETYTAGQRVWKAKDINWSLVKWFRVNSEVPNVNMTEQQFCYWLQGFVEIMNGQQPNQTQWQVIQDHLKLVFTKVTPDRYTTQPVPIPAQMRWPLGEGVAIC